MTYFDQINPINDTFHQIYDKKRPHPYIVIYDVIFAFFSFLAPVFSERGDQKIFFTPIFFSAVFIYIPYYPAYKSRRL